MTRARQRIAAAWKWSWTHASAAAALVLILLALLVGYWIGRPASEPTRLQGPAADTGAAPEGATMYTCSMHPSVRLPDPDAKCPICYMDLIPVTVAGSDTEPARHITISQDAARLSGIETAPVGRFFPRAMVRLYGKVTYDETAVARLTAYFPGRIERLFVNYVGVPVTKGDHVAEIYSPDLLAAFEELRQARRALDETGAGSELVRIATRDTLEAAREKLRLYGLTETQVEAAEKGTFDSTRLTVFAPIGGVVTNLAVREGDYVDVGEPVATVANLSRLWLDLEAYESQLPMLRWGQAVTFTVEAHPGERFEGRISFIEPMVDDRSRTAAVRVAVDNTDRRLKPGMFASAVVRPRIAAGGAVVSDELAGKWVGPMHPTIVRDGPGQCDICGMDLVSAESLGVVGDPGAAVEPLVIPRSAVLFTGARSVVYVEVEGAERPTYEGREVTLGSRAGDFYVVREGLSEGESVVVHGAFRIDSAMQISAKPSMMSPEGGGAAGHDHGGRAIAGRGGDRVAAIRDDFIYSLKPVYAAYLGAQESLADDDLGGFVQAAQDLNTALDLVSEVGLVGEPLAAWRRAAAELRTQEPFTDLGRARARFETMSDGVIELQRRFGHRGSQTWHIAYCPMAFDNKGADWLQRGEQIDNPYFGAAMLRCGEIRDTLPPLDEPAGGAEHEGHRDG